jgi:exodeoxyribonuclease VII large subunit
MAAATLEREIRILMQTYTLFELNEHIRRVLALNFSEALWIRCEIAQVKENRGHCYLELVQKAEESDEVIARSEAAIWQTALRRMRLKIGPELSSLLRDGMEVQLQARVDFHERYGLKLIIEDVDPAYTLGRLELQRRKTIQHLQELQLLKRNGQLPLPLVPQRIAVITSEKAAGMQDYFRQLEENPYGYRFRNRLFTAGVQGRQVETEIIAQLERIRRSRELFDCVVIIRGGGSRLDLSAFDSFQLCKAVAEFPLPVLTGIGHDVDETVLDLVAHTRLKTPTAVAEFIVSRCLQFESAVMELGHLLKLLANQQIKEQELGIQRLAQKVQFQSHQLLQGNLLRLERLEGEIAPAARYRLRSDRLQLDQMERICNLLSLDSTLKRGFTLTLKDGKAVARADELKSGDAITTKFSEGEVNSLVK